MSTPTDLVADRAYCRAVLGRVSRTFALNIRLLRAHFGEAVRVGYLLCRTADALEDSWVGSPEEIGARFDQFLAALDGDSMAAHSLAEAAAQTAAGRPDLALVAELPRVLRVTSALPGAHRDAVRDGVRTLATGMRRYATRAAARSPHAPYLDTEAELDDYCWIVAGCVGVMLTDLFAAEYGVGDETRHRRRLELAPVVGRALQLTNILLDWPADVRRGRCYLPATWLAEFGLEVPDLVGTPNAGVHALAERLTARARGALVQVPEYVDAIPARRVRYRLFCVWPALWALGSLRATRRTPDFPWGEARPRISRFEVFGTALTSALTVHSGRTLRWQWDVTARPPVIAR
ncbi:MAG: squalene/phytoene synthase family protein [Candidatus Eisenbacteria bacterium]|uniref:Squalene/phytoene synthase family protein n=1 Tax=Eiseniibacteriota bacterium TaxID=2212470 RepID=A0A849SCE3_UNCEI|nr:squalene/phytoene synthase family protein [Candidatus Eisenbacteria bacterium]